NLTDGRRHVCEELSGSLEYDRNDESLWKREWFSSLMHDGMRPSSRCIVWTLEG
ncbi:Hypothetical predicted protein, partial [Olea europaea subsp. europaea]